MRVKRAFQQVLLAHELPERLDEATRSFAALANISINELPQGGPARYAIFDLRWAITQNHAYGNAGDIVVVDDGVRVLNRQQFDLQYVPITEPERV